MTTAVTFAIGHDYKLLYLQESTMEGAQAYIQQTELSKRVQHWEDKIRPILASEVGTHLD